MSNRAFRPTVESRSRQIACIETAECWRSAERRRQNIDRVSVSFDDVVARICVVEARSVDHRARRSTSGFRSVFQSSLWLETTHSANKSVCVFGSIASSVSTTSSSSEASTSAVATTTSTKLDEDTLTREINWLLSRLPAVSLKLHEPDVVVFNALVHLLVLAGKLDTAQAVMHRVMPLYGARPDTVTYNVLIRGFVRDGSSTKTNPSFYLLCAPRLSLLCVYLSSSLHRQRPERRSDRRSVSSHARDARRWPRRRRVHVRVALSGRQQGMCARM